MFVRRGVWPYWRIIDDKTLSNGFVFTRRAVERLMWDFGLGRDPLTRP